MPEQTKLEHLARGILIMKKRYGFSEKEIAIKLGAGWTEQEVKDMLETYKDLNLHPEMPPR